MLHRVAATVDTQALRHNLAVVRRHAPDCRIAAMIKANAYGHGLLQVAEALEGANLFGVTDINEAELLRAGGTDKPILILQGIISAGDVARIAAGGFQLVVHRSEDLQLLEQHLDQHPPAQPLTFWLKLQSGMGRLGLEPDAFVKAYQALQRKAWVADIVMMTHLANSALPDSPLNQQQLECFRQVRQGLPAGVSSSIAASAGLLALDCSGDWVRPGIMLYGSSPFPWSDAPRRREAFGLQAVMTLQARLLAIHDHKAGDNIGYNSQFICPQAMRIGIVSIGYADGYPSNTPNGCPVAIRGQRTVTTGRVSMDMLAIDLTDIAAAQPGDAVMLWGNAVSLDEVAAHTGILSYNLTCSISPRVPMLYV